MAQKPWAAGLQAGYGFDVWGKSQNVYLGYQASRETAGLNLPKNRWLAGYGIDIVKIPCLALSGITINNLQRATADKVT